MRYSSVSNYKKQNKSEKMFLKKFWMDLSLKQLLQ